MELQNSYIFLKESDSDMTKDSQGNYHLVLGDSILDRLKVIFPDLHSIGAGTLWGKKEYCGSLTLSKQVIQIKLAISNVAGTAFLDVAVNSKTTSQCVKAMEHIHEKLLEETFTQGYIPIVSYDAVSEYFCNKAFPMLNTLERNLRKLLFNTYISNFGKEYYQVTISEDIQKKAKQLISNKGGTRAKEIRRIQEFFYSLEYGDIEAMLFTPVWTKLEEDRKQKFLNENVDLLKLSDQELRDVISGIQPLSDWDRFFSKKVTLQNTDAMLDKLRGLRNTVAHVKFFYRNDYNTCKSLVESLNAAIIEAIRITEDEEFVEKNRENLQNSVAGVLEKVQNFTHWVGERAVKTAQALAPLAEKLGKTIAAMYQEDASSDGAINQELNDLDDTILPEN